MKDILEANIERLTRKWRFVKCEKLLEFRRSRKLRIVGSNLSLLKCSGVSREKRKSVRVRLAEIKKAAEVIEKGRKEGYSILTNNAGIYVICP